MALQFVIDFVSKVNTVEGSFRRLEYRQKEYNRVLAQLNPKLKRIVDSQNKMSGATDVSSKAMQKNSAQVNKLMRDLMANEKWLNKTTSAQLRAEIVTSRLTLKMHKQQLATLQNTAAKTDEAKADKKKLMIALESEIARHREILDRTLLKQEVVSAIAQQKVANNEALKAIALKEAGTTANAKFLASLEGLSAAQLKDLSLTKANEVATLQKTAAEIAEGSLAGSRIAVAEAQLGIETQLAIKEKSREVRLINTARALLVKSEAEAADIALQHARYASMTQLAVRQAAFERSVQTLTVAEAERLVLQKTANLESLKTQEFMLRQTLLTKTSATEKRKEAAAEALLTIQLEQRQISMLKSQIEVVKSNTAEAERAALLTASSATIKKLSAEQGYFTASVDMMTEAQMRNSVIQKSQYLDKLKNHELNIRQGVETRGRITLKEQEMLADMRLRIEQEKRQIQTLRNIATGEASTAAERQRVATLTAHHAVVSRLITQQTAFEASLKKLTTTEIDALLVKKTKNIEDLKTERMKVKQILLAEMTVAGVTKETAAELRLRIEQEQRQITMLKGQQRTLAGAAATNRATGAVNANTAAVAANSGALRTNHWLGVSYGGGIEKLGTGMRISGFDIGFMTMHLGTFGIAAAVATSALNMVGSEFTSIEQLRFAVENLGLAWDAAKFEDKVMTLRDATGNTAKEIREIMATLGAVTGGLIHSQDELVDNAELVLDVMIRTNASAQLASRIVARTLAGNLESLRERFPGLTAEIDALREAGASLQEKSDWGMAALTEQVGGAASEIAIADKVSASLRNSMIQVAVAIGRLVVPTMFALAKVLELVGEAVTFLGPVLPLLTAGFMALKVALIVTSSGATSLVGALYLLTSPVGLLVGGLAALGLAVRGVNRLFSQNVSDADRHAASLAAAARLNLITAEEVVDSDDSRRRSALAVSQAYTEQTISARIHQERLEGEPSLLRDIAVAQEEVTRYLDDYSNAENARQIVVNRSSTAMIEMADVQRWLTREQYATTEGLSEFVDFAGSAEVALSGLEGRLESMIRLFREHHVVFSDSTELFERISDSDMRVPWVPEGPGALESFDEILRVDEYREDLARLIQEFEAAGGEATEAILKAFSGGTSEDRDKALEDLEGASEEALEIIREYWERERQEALYQRREQLTSSQEHHDAMLKGLEDFLEEKARAWDRAQKEAERAAERRRREAERQRERELRDFQRQMSRLGEDMLENMLEEEVQWEDHLLTKRLALKSHYIELAQIERDAAKDRSEQLAQIASDDRDRMLDTLSASFEDMLADPDLAAARLKLGESMSIGDIMRSDLEVQDAWMKGTKSIISSTSGMLTAIGDVVEEATGQKAIVYTIEGIAQLAYAAASFMRPWDAAQHGIAAASFFYAASQAGKLKGGGGGGTASSTQKAPVLTRRRQQLEESPDQNLRSPSGLSFVMMVDLRGSIGMDGRRLGNDLLGVINQGQRFRSGHQLDPGAVGGMRW